MYGFILTQTSALDVPGFGVGALAIVLVLVVISLLLYLSGGSTGDMKKLTQSVERVSLFDLLVHEDTHAQDPNPKVTVLGAALVISLIVGILAAAGYLVRLGSFR